MQLTFVTGNQHKADKTAQLLGRELSHQKVDLDEIQTTDLVRLARHKVQQAYDILQTPVIIDDFGFGIDAYGGLPGPFTKFFTHIDDGLEKLCRMADLDSSRGAVITCVIAYCDGRTLEVFERSLSGKVAQHPIGDKGIDTDQVFIPAGYNMTRAQMDEETYDEVYQLIRPLGELKEFLSNYER